jgi:hypothetical protein
MDHAITIGDVIRYTLWVGGAALIIAIIFYVVFVLLNPFSSGH